MYARYVKITVTSNNNTQDYTTEINELEIYDSTNTKIPLTVNMITAPTHYGGSNTIDKMIDGNTTTGYATYTNYPVNIIIDLGSVKDITKIRHYAGTLLNVNFNFKNYTISFAETANNYTVVTTITNNVTYNAWREYTYASAIVSKILIQDGTDDNLSQIKYYDGSAWQTIAGKTYATLTDSDFITYGMNTVPTKAQLDQLNSIYRLLTWTNDLAKTYIVNLKAIPKDQIVFASGNFGLLNVSNVNYFKAVGAEAAGGKVRLIVSNDSGNTYHGYVGNNFVPLTFADKSNLTLQEIQNAFASGMTLAQVSDTGITDWSDIFPSEVVEKFASWAYYLSMETSTDTAYVDNLVVSVNRNGTLRYANCTEWDGELLNDRILFTWLGAPKEEIRVTYTKPTV